MLDFLSLPYIKLSDYNFIMKEELMLCYEIIEAMEDRLDALHLQIYVKMGNLLWIILEM